MSIRQLIRGRLSPVGEPIVLGGESAPIEASIPAGYVSQAVNSGTAALSLAMSLAAVGFEGDSAEVILPAYGCPDLLAAADYAGLKPVLVDIEAQSPRYCVESLRAAINDRTVAIVAVNFLGINEDFPRLRALIGQRNIVLIEDNAQYFPVQSTDGCYSGDLVVLSFGRGKPISQVGGGALLATMKFSELISDRATTLAFERVREWQWRLKARLFNLVLQPQYYQLLLMLPFLHIGETRYHALEQIQRMDPWRLHYLEVNIEAYRARSRRVQKRLDELLQGESCGLLNLPRMLGCIDKPLLRYPVLCTSDEQCAELYRGLLDGGLGVSRMYERPLDEISDVPHAFSVGYEGASQFSRRLITLPVTSFVDDARLERIRACLQSVA